MAEIPQTVYYRFGRDGIAVNLFTTSTATVALESGATVTVAQETDYPSSGRVELRVTPAAASAFVLRFRIPRWCRCATVHVNGEDPAAVPAGAGMHEIRRTWTAGDTVTLDMPMPWRLIRGHQMQEGKVALLRGPVVYCLGTAQNEELLKKYPNFQGVVVDPASLGKPEADASVRPDGRKVTAGARVEAPGVWSQGAPRATVTFTEFVDPTGIATYFHVLDAGAAEEDELVSDCFTG